MEKLNIDNQNAKINITKEDETQIFEKRVIAVSKLVLSEKARLINSVHVPGTNSHTVDI